MDLACEKVRESRGWFHRGSSLAAGLLPLVIGGDFRRYSTNSEAIHFRACQNSAADSNTAEAEIRSAHRMPSA